MCVKPPLLLTLTQCYVHLCEAVVNEVAPLEVLPVHALGTSIRRRQRMVFMVLFLGCLMGNYPVAGMVRPRRVCYYAI